MSKAACRRLAGALLLAAAFALPSAAGAQSVEELASAGALRPLLERARAAAAASVLTAPAYPVAARIPLGGENDYWDSPLVFTAEGVKIHLSGNKDPLQGDHDGYFFSMLEDGAREPQWVAADTKPVPFEVRGKTYFIKIDLSLKTALFHVERLKIVVTKKDDPSYRVELLAGQIAAGLLSTGRPFALGGRPYRALYMAQIVEKRRGPGQWSTTAARPGHHTLMVGRVMPYTFDGGKACAKFDLMVFDGETIEGSYPNGQPKLWPKSLKLAVGGRERVVTYGFHIEDSGGGKTLVVYDMSAPSSLASR